MNIIPANDLKTKGIKAIEEALMQQTEVSVSVRGQSKYVSHEPQSISTPARM